jgi:hypothetical protein
MSIDLDATLLEIEEAFNGSWPQRHWHEEDISMGRTPEEEDEHLPPDDDEPGDEVPPPPPEPSEGSDKP